MGRGVGGGRYRAGAVDKATQIREGEGMQHSPLLEVSQGLDAACVLLPAILGLFQLWQQVVHPGNSLSSGRCRAHMEGVISSITSRASLQCVNPLPLGELHWECPTGRFPL